MNGNAEGSTLRLTLGCLLPAELGLELRRVGNGNRYLLLTFCDGGHRFSAWLDENAFVTWEACCEPLILEETLIRHVSKSGERMGSARTMRIAVRWGISQRRFPSYSSRRRIS